MRTLSILFAAVTIGNAASIWKTTAGVDIHWDNNVGDNVTHVSETWGVPFASLLFRQPLKGSREWSMQADLQYENAFTSRSPTLNAPLDQYIFRASQGISKDFLISVLGKTARTFDSDMRLVKILGRAGTALSWSPSVWKVEFDFHHDWENYGDHSQDGNTRWYTFDLRYSLWKSLQLGWGYSMEDRQAYSPAYTYVDQKLEAKFRYSVPKGASFSLDCSRSYKMYSTSKRNQEWQAAALLSIPFGNMKAKTEFAGKDTHSNTPGYSWSEKSSTTSIEWSMDNKGTKKKRKR